MELTGVRVEPITNMPIIILRDREGQRVLPIWVGVFEANAIALQMENVTTPRPMTHDLLKNILEDLAIAVERIVVTELRDSTFYATIRMQRGTDSFEISSRPSDAIALAVRMATPIYASEDVLDEASILIPGDEEEEVEKFREFLDNVSPEDFES
jgi:bifunctional DNase/RNase